MKKKILVLGGGPLQVPLIKKAKQEGYEVYLSDYYPNPPGKQYCDHSRQISTMSVEENLGYARECSIDYILTVGTDQPVLTAATVSERLGLPFPISADQGKWATHKSFMKSIMVQAGVPSPGFNIYNSFDEVSWEELPCPAVMKPADSQGQRGVFVLNGSEDKTTRRDLFNTSIGFSPTATVVIEEFYPGPEITVNCWVKDGQAHILLITDRLHYQNSTALGLCTQQRYPSRVACGKEEEIQGIAQKLVNAFGIKDGPLYIQAIAGQNGVKIVEFGYRIGGGFESETIPRITGVDILDLYFILVTKGENRFLPSMRQAKVKLGSIFFMFAREGTAKQIILPPEFLTHNGRLYVREGDNIGKMDNAAARIGCFAVYEEDPEAYGEMLSRINSGMAIYDQHGRDLIIHGLWE